MNPAVSVYRTLIPIQKAVINMRKEYIGKTCPYCKTPLVEGDTVVFCSVCDMPHHLSCWQDNQGCTTFGCTGSIKEIIGNDSGVATALVAPQPVPAPVVTPKPAPAKQAPAPVRVEQTEKPIETLYESKEMVFMSDVPLVLENAAIIIDRTKDKLFARCTFRSITDKAIKAVLIEVSCQDVWGSTLGEPVAFQYLDLQTKKDSKFGQTNPVELPDKTTRKIQVAVKKVLFADASVISGGGVAFTMPAPVLLSKHLGSDALAAEYARETSHKAKFVPADGSHYWLCACGALNENSEEKCYNCGCTKEQLMSALNPDALQANMINFAAEKKAAADKAQAEQAERIRRAEEQVRLEQEQKEREFKQAENLEKSRKRRKKTVRAIIISLIVIAVVGCGTIFFGIPYFNYRAACDALDNGEYDTAYQAFVALGNFMDSEEMANEALYQKAETALRNEQYDSAFQIFTDLGDYNNSQEMAHQVLYEKAEQALKNKQYDSAIEIFGSLGDYKDSEDQVLEAKYLKADKCQTDKKYAEAYQLFVELGNYKESQDEVLATILLWETEALGYESMYEAYMLSQTVKLSSDQYEMFYSIILLYLNAHEDANYWHDGSVTTHSRNVQIMLEMLPSTYKDTSTLLKLFNLIAQVTEGYDEFFRDNESLMRQCWSLAFVQDLAEEDRAITYFLEGYWSTYSGDYYINFYENDSGSTSCEYNLPRVSEPSGTKYYDIEDMIFYWENKDYKRLTKVYRFEIVDYDTIKVFCYKNNRTYTLYR